MFADFNLVSIWITIRDTIASPLVADGASALAAGATTWVLLTLFRLFILRRLHRVTHTTEEDVSFAGRVVEIIESLPVYVDILIALFVGSQFVVLPDLTANIIRGLAIAITVFEITRVTTRLTKTLLDAWWRRGTGRTPTGLQGIRVLISIALWAAAFLIVLSSLGFEVSTLVASLGVTGIVVAFALQNILADIFSSFSLYFDRPFEIGDSIEIGADSGTVKRIGLKTTHIVTNRGERLIVSNRELTSTRVRNFRYLKRRRLTLALTVAGDTSVATLKKIPTLVREQIESVERATFERAHLTAVADAGFTFEIVYFAETAEGDWLDIQEVVTLAILDAFEKAKIELAYPTRTVYLKK